MIHSFSRFRHEAGREGVTEIDPQAYSSLDDQSVEPVSRQCHYRIKATTFAFWLIFKTNAEPYWF
ncbi:MAG: hypothetical protein VXZ15_13475, partial [Planctomycetota bacterium]|nr:hypothetical protein [Planctomycetota bacterium]